MQASFLAYIIKKSKKPLAKNNAMCYHIIMSFDVNKILSNYDIKGKLVQNELFGEGHINETVLLVFDDNGKEVKYILQRINEKIFRNVDGLMNNIRLVTEFMADKIKNAGGDPHKECLTIVYTKDGKSYLHNESGYFRIYNYIDGVAYQIAKPELFYQSALAFGTFAKNLADFDASKLYESIPNFHNTKKRFADFKAFVAKNASGKADSVKKEIDFVLERESYCGRIVDLIESGKMPNKVTHNDTKLNNVLLDKDTGKCLAVVDLDTIMPGSICYDFGDSIRFGCNTSTEDERDLSKVNFDINLFESYAKGYLTAIGDGITEIERKNLAFSAILMTYECGMRFLGDHIDGDNYFRISRENHNLDRARTQFKLIEDMEKLLPEMEKIIEKY